MSDAAQATTAETPSEEEAGVALEKAVHGALQKVNQGTISFQDLLSAIAPPAPVVAAPTKLPVPAAITPEQRAALKKLDEVFGKVVPTERRALTEAEIGDLLTERQTLTVIEGFAKKRKEDIRTTALNHFDVTFEAIPEEERPAGVTRDKDGHYVVKQQAGAPGHTKKFSAEVTKGKITMDPAKLEAMADDPAHPEITHQDYLDATRQVRIFDEAKFLLLLRKKPRLLTALREASNRDNPSLTFTER